MIFALAAGVPGEVDGSALRVLLRLHVFDFELGFAGRFSRCWHFLFFLWLGRCRPTRPLHWI